MRHPLPRLSALTDPPLLKVIKCNEIIYVTPHGPLNLNWQSWNWEQLLPLANGFYVTKSCDEPSILQIICIHATMFHLLALCKLSKRVFFSTFMEDIQKRDPILASGALKSAFLIFWRGKSRAVDYTWLNYEINTFGNSYSRRLYVYNFHYYCFLYDRLNINSIINLWRIIQGYISK